MDLNTKIQQILIDKNISSSQFADAIGVTRSGISHILSGRNRPSLDLVQKIIVQYPELGTAWILDSEPLPDSPNTTVREKPKETLTNPRRKDNGKPIINPVNLIQAKVTPSDMGSLPIPDKEVKIMERVLMFYSDGTFKEYSPM